MGASSVSKRAARTFAREIAVESGVGFSRAECPVPSKPFRLAPLGTERSGAGRARRKEGARKKFFLGLLITH
jgi:hypothetical protein